MTATTSNTPAKKPRYVQETDVTLEEMLEDLDGSEVREIERYFGATLADLMTANVVALQYGAVWAHKKQNGEPKLSLRHFYDSAKLGYVMAYFASDEQDVAIEEHSEAGKGEL